MTGDIDVRGESPPVRGERASQPLIAAGLVAAVVAVLFLVERADAVPRGTVLRGPAAWTVAGLIVLAGVGLLVHGLVRRTAWHYDEQDERDEGSEAHGRSGPCEPEV